MQSLASVVSSCIMQQPGTDDGAGVDQSDDQNKMAIDWMESVDQIRLGAHLDKAQRIEMANIAAAVSQEGAATVMRKTSLNS